MLRAKASNRKKEENDDTLCCFDNGQIINLISYSNNAAFTAVCNNGTTEGRLAGATWIGERPLLV